MRMSRWVLSTEIPDRDGMELTSQLQRRRGFPAGSNRTRVFLFVFVFLISPLITLFLEEQRSPIFKGGRSVLKQQICCSLRSTVLNVYFTFNCMRGGGVGVGAEVLDAPGDRVAGHPQRWDWKLNSGRLLQQYSLFPATHLSSPSVQPFSILAVQHLSLPSASLREKFPVHPCCMEAW